jgi:heavy metal sensor kinase
MSWRTGVKAYRRTDLKIALWYLLTFLISGLIICGFLYLRLEHQLIKEVDRFLLDETKELSDLLTRSPDPQEALKNFERGAIGRIYFPICFSVLDSKGIPIYRSENFEEMSRGRFDPLDSAAQEGLERREDIVSSKGLRFRVINSPVYKKEHLVNIVQVGTPLSSTMRSLSNFRGNLLSALPIVLLLGAFGGWILARKSLSPIGYIASMTESITSRNLSEQLERRGTEDEMDHLTDTINGMIRRLDNSFKKMAQFTADASHELKTPLCAMRGEAEVLLSRERSPQEYQEGLGRFIELFDHLNQMINDLILLSKIDSSQGELKMRPLRLDLLVNDVVHLFQILAEQKKIALSTDGLREATVHGDKMRLQQLFTNLIDNAIKYTAAGGIRVTMEVADSSVEIRVTDTGVGIPEEEQANIFQRFYRVDKSRSRETGGAGLGLSIAESIVHAHQGKITVRSSPGEGTTILVTLPCFHPLIKKSSS